MSLTDRESRHLSVHVDRTVDEVYAYASDPANLPAWAHGLGQSIEKVGEEWIADSSPLGRVTVRFVPRNELGVLDHDVTLPSGETFHNPVRVIADGTGSEVVFTLRRQPGTSDGDFERDAETVAADLARLKELLESAQGPSGGSGSDGP
ncbi:SRPBCC family protein [Streptomyces sp. NK15101]|uniref:SRPBCC family protein n=1 Tax=Streptomyces sp. NK15101 TaxID=2873261 RepID=UPI001CED20C7|nr:SRPBCC family protein [Streptomyces sp. NK15101]